MTTTTLQEDIDYVKSILPNHYIIKESKNIGSIHCHSSIGLRTNDNADDKEHWQYIGRAIHNYFDREDIRIQEIYFNTNAYYQDFTIYLKR